MLRLFLPILILILSGCDSSRKSVNFSGKTMGTSYNVTVVVTNDQGKVDQIQGAIDATLVDVNAKMSNWDPNSEISKFNRSESTDFLPISEHLYEVMYSAERVHKASLGQLDVTLGPLIELWGFGSKERENETPSAEAIAAALDRVGLSEVIELRDQPELSMKKKYPDTSVYLASLAKGYGIDRVALAIEDLGFSDFMVEIGGDIYVSGENVKSKPWRIGVERPSATEMAIEKIISTSNLGMATSGDYRIYFEKDGVRYSHIIDAQTGVPVTHKTASVTVLAENAMMADAWATALLVLGSEAGMSIAEKEELAVLFIVRDEQDNSGFSLVASSKFEKMQPMEMEKTK